MWVKVSSAVAMVLQELNLIANLTVGPSLGQDSVQKGVQAAILAAILVVLLMVIYYKMSGVIADFALILNSIMLVGVLVAIRATLTLPGIAGIAEVVSEAYPDATQFDRRSPYFDPKATRASPRWLTVNVKCVRKTHVIGLAELRRHPELAGMRVLARGNRLSITPVERGEWAFITGTLLKPDSPAGRGTKGVKR